MVERQLPKLNVAGSIPVSRSKCIVNLAASRARSFRQLERRQKGILGLSTENAKIPRPLVLIVSTR